MDGFNRDREVRQFLTKEGGKREAVLHMAAVITSTNEQLHAVLLGYFTSDVRVCWCECVAAYEGRLLNV